jgi:flagellar motor protein MotB
MTFARVALLVPLLATLALTGCRNRGASDTVESAERLSEVQRLTGEVNQLERENSSLRAQLQSAKDQLAKGKSPTAGEQMAKILKGDDIEGVTATERGGLALNDDFAFAKGSDELSPEGKSSINKLAARLNTGEYSSSKVIVEGHTDDTPVARASTKEKFHDNWGLSGARAAAVIRALQAAGVSPKRVQGQFRGEYSPRGGEKAANRRVEIFLGE